MQHLDQVLNAAREGLQSGIQRTQRGVELVYWTKELEQLFRAVYRAGYNEHKRQHVTIPRVNVLEGKNYSHQPMNTKTTYDL